MATTAQGKANIHDSYLMTADPYHLPGYGGYCPQLKYRVGQTFGAATSRLLHDPYTASSGKIVLANKKPTNKLLNSLQQAKEEIVGTRKASTGSQKLVNNMIPGYTGFIPKEQNYFGKRYAENCLNAISDFEHNQRERNNKIAQIRYSNATATRKLELHHFDDLRLPVTSNRYLEPVDPIMSHYVSKDTPAAQISPYYMDNKNPQKFFMSGYTGFVPCTRKLLGQGYPQLTNRGLVEFTDTIKRNKSLSAEPVKIHRQPQVTIQTKPIYPVKSGLIPHYTGHVPGVRFKQGHTYGFGTIDALRRGPGAPKRPVFAC